MDELVLVGFFLEAVCSVQMLLERSMVMAGSRVVTRMEFLLLCATLGCHIRAFAMGMYPVDAGYRSFYCVSGVVYLASSEDYGE